MNKNILILSALCLCSQLFAEEVTVKSYKYAGPYEVKKPFLLDSLDVNSKKFTEKELLKTTVPFHNIRKNQITLDAGEAGFLLLPATQSSSTCNLNLVSFYLNSDRYVNGSLQINGLENYEVYIDNEKKTAGNGTVSLPLEPRRYEVIIKYLVTDPAKQDSLKVTYQTDTKAVVTASVNPEKRYTLN